MSALVKDAGECGPVRLLSAEQVATEIFNRNVTAKWVRLRVPGARRFGHRTVLWVESEVRTWALQQEERPLSVHTNV